MTRLHELKAAKHRAEERLQIQSVGSSSADSVSSGHTFQSVCDPDVEDDIKRAALMFAASFGAYAVLFLLNRHPYVSAITSSSSATRAILDLIMVSLQAVTLRALLCGVAVYTFEAIDLGQKKLLANMSLGKRLFVKSVKQFSLAASACVAAMSCGLGLAARQFCSFNLMSTLSRARGFLPSVDMHRMMSSFNFARLFSLLPGSLKVILVKAGPADTAMGRWKVCESGDAMGGLWTSRAVGISGFVTLRISIFVLALVCMLHLFMPKSIRTKQK